MRILGYRGKSITSRLIQAQTRSEHSHIGVQISGGRVIEAWQGPGVRLISHDFDQERVEVFLRSQLGKKYDYSSVFRFVTRRDAIANDKIFCSELAELAFIAGGLPLLNGNPSHHSPRDTLLSPYLKFEKTIT